MPIYAARGINRLRGIHLTGLAQVSGSPGPGRPWAFDPRRMAPLARWRGWLRLGLRVRGQVPVAARFVADGEFEHAVEDQSSAVRSAAAAAEHERLRVGLPVG